MWSIRRSGFPIVSFWLPMIWRWTCCKYCTRLRAESTRFRCLTWSSVIARLDCRHGALYRIRTPCVFHVPSVAPQSRTVAGFALVIFGIQSHAGGGPALPDVWDEPIFHLGHVGIIAVQFLA